MKTIYGILITVISLFITSCSGDPKTDTLTRDRAVAYGFKNIHSTNACFEFDSLALEIWQQSQNNISEGQAARILDLTTIKWNTDQKTISLEFIKQWWKERGMHIAKAISETLYQNSLTLEQIYDLPTDDLNRQLWAQDFSDRLYKIKSEIIRSSEVR